MTMTRKSNRVPWLLHHHFHIITVCPTYSPTSHPPVLALLQSFLMTPPPSVQPHINIHIIISALVAAEEPCHCSHSHPLVPSSAILIVAHNNNITAGKGAIPSVIIFHLNRTFRPCSPPPVRRKMAAMVLSWRLCDNDFRAHQQSSHTNVYAPVLVPRVPPQHNVQLSLPYHPSCLLGCRPYSCHRHFPVIPAGTTTLLRIAEGDSEWSPHKGPRPRIYSLPHQKLIISIIIAWRRVMDREEDQNTCLVLILGFRTQYLPYVIHYWHAVWPAASRSGVPSGRKWSELKGGQTGIPGAKWVGECLALHNSTSPLYRPLIISSAGVAEEEEERKQHGVAARVWW